MFKILKEFENKPPPPASPVWTMSTAEERGRGAYFQEDTVLARVH